MAQKACLLGQKRWPQAVGRARVGQALQAGGFCGISRTSGISGFGGISGAQAWV